MSLPSGSSPTQSRYSRGTQIQYREREPLGKIVPCRAYTLIYRGTQIQYREREPLGKGNPILQSLHSNILRDIDTIQGEGTLCRRAYTLITKGTQIQYRETKQLGEGNPALHNLHSNIQRDTDIIQGEGTIGRRKTCPAELTLLIYRGT
ncbi:hypothetical protein XELAEV_18021633mg [Xenopus laevis]|uniref:Uncharacterized protein n=1 Tax=Xenopus laevis TaxID=8355 RepID=A0A974DBL2_XENLA|nr:hypothetical protein XELAEV_18021633mg [Xenopus laevis]